VQPWPHTWIIIKQTRRHAYGREIRCLYCPRIQISCSTFFQEAASRWDRSIVRQDVPAPTDLQLEFIKASEEAEAERTNAERLRFEEMRAAQAERARALADRESAVRKLSRRTTIGLVSSGALTAAAAGFAYWGLDAERRFRIARQQAAEAEKSSVEAAITKEAIRTDIVGQFVAHAASPNQFASEGPIGGNSPYTAELLLRLSNSSVSLYEACFAGNLNVQRNSRQRQRPFI
jgi:hypothetical protein